MKADQHFEPFGASQAHKACSQPSSALELDIFSLRGDRGKMEIRTAPLRRIDESVMPFGLSGALAGRKRPEEKSGEDWLDLRQMTETIPVMLWSATPDGAIDYCNGRVLDYTGCSAKDVKNEGWAKLLHPEDVDQATETWMSCITTGAPYRVEARTFHAADRTYRWCVTSALPLRDKRGSILKWHGAVVDVHDWKQAQEELRRAQLELAHMTRVMTMGELVASIAHEVNQPLASIITNGQTGLRRLARPEPDIEKVREATGRMVADARRASEIINRIRAMATRKAPQHTPLSLNEVIQESMDLLRPEFQLRGISVSLDLAPGLPYVVGDRTQLQQVIVNLALNAIQAMTRSMRTRRSLAVRAMLSNPKTVFCSVEDSGAGIAAEHLPHLFESFFTTKDTGMGMGLPICRSIIEAHRGQIRADCDSALGGARFSFTVPANGED